MHYFRFLTGKPLINVESIPVFQFRLDKPGGLEKLSSKIAQSRHVPSEAIAVQLESDLPDIRDVSALISILQTTASIVMLIDNQKLDLDEPLPEVICSLQITASRDLLPKPLGQFRLRHLEAAIKRLNFVRARRMVQNEVMPFVWAQMSFLEPLPLELIPSVEKMLHHVRPGDKIYRCVGKVKTSYSILPNGFTF